MWEKICVTSSVFKPEGKLKRDRRTDQRLGFVSEQTITAALDKL